MTAGFMVYTTIRDRNQAAANHALRTAILEYDVRHGYRGAESNTELEAGMVGQRELQFLESFPVIANLYPALVIDVRETSVTAQLTGIGPIDIEWNGLRWARRYISENYMGPVPASASDIVKAGDIIRVTEDDNGEWRLSQLPAVEGSLVSLDPQNGATLALTGGFDFYRSNFNRVTQAKRQPGSGFKPFVYSAALEEGFTAASIINDAPLVHEVAGVEEAWRPENYSGRYYGPTRLRQALVQSMNIASVRLLDAVGIDKALKHIAKFGFDTSELPPTLSLALGSGDLTSWQMASAYSVFANGGYLIEPYFIERIEDHDGNLIFNASPAIVCEACVADKPEIAALAGYAEDHTLPDLLVQDKLPDTEMEVVTDKKPVRYAKRVVDPQNIWIMNSIGRDVVRRGTATRALALNRQDLAGKTGTTNDQRDAWFFGYNSAVVTVTWVGFDNYRGLGVNEVGGRAALPMWIDYMRIALAGVPESSLDPPAGLVTARIDPATGNLASGDNPNAIFEYFRAEYVPTVTPEDRTANTSGNQRRENLTPQTLF